jgi:hypothetical protein
VGLQVVPIGQPGKRFTLLQMPSTATSEASDRNQAASFSWRIHCFGFGSTAQFRQAEAQEDSGQQWLLRLMPFCVAE